MKAKVLGAAAVLAFLGFGAPASATIVTVVYTGTVYEGYDRTGIFGAAGGDLAGDSYVARYVFDTTQGLHFGPTSSFGGSYYGALTPVVSASVTINGHFASLNGTWSGVIDAESFGFFANAEEHSINNDIEIGKHSINIIYSLSYTDPVINPFTYLVKKTDLTEAEIGFFNYDYVSQKYAQNASAHATLNTLTVSTGVPEPSTWALLLLGFAGLGFAGHRHAKQTTAPLPTA
jgi:hypothetical protein